LGIQDVAVLSGISISFEKTCATFPFNHNLFMPKAQALLFQYPHFWLVSTTVRYTSQLPLSPDTTIYGMVGLKGTQGKNRAWHSRVTLWCHGQDTTREFL
jgi:hypothetical protein